MRKVAVIGGGWAGCAAAVELAGRGSAVTLYESARSPGGRARAVSINGVSLDNGQHILLGAYSESLRLLRVVGVRTEDALLRLPLQMRYPNGSGMDFVTPRLPAPLHMLAGLIRAKGLDRDDKLALARFSTTARWMDWRLNVDCSVDELLRRFDQTETLIRLMWQPLCIAALNTPPERASAQVFLNVLRDSLGARRAASDMLIPRVDLGTLFPKRAVEFIERHGARVAYGTTVSALQANGSCWKVCHQDGGEEFDAIVVATSAHQAARLLSSLMDTSLLDSLEHEPITTCYLQYGAALSLEHPFFALADDERSRCWGQFVFDRGQLDPTQAGLLAVVISASSAAIAERNDALARDVTAQLATVFGKQELMSPKWVKVISEKRATFSCRPGLTRPLNDTGIRGLVLAGDYTAGDYPATLEAAIRSGVQAAAFLRQ
ncbi:hydroxysqualene dehydroxylase HpnE [Noviherbaspirillum saxi]|uniref:FAD-dependent oxidoreductase n=1 Tax=Noviherbaspirillum saxi TaxID=2320863 RepID=A0A3A3FV65_9BURK|nr:hydroxysqualene dehydroxylase HpnE [Noviherbaspirillum saxi]RJF98448.1 FAD-dependent oxidoreductase [Noviherbaspirillum saxi]